MTKTKVSQKTTTSTKTKALSPTAPVARVEPARRTEVAVDIATLTRLIAPTLRSDSDDVLDVALDLLSLLGEELQGVIDIDAHAHESGSDSYPLVANHLFHMKERVEAAHELLCEIADVAKTVQA